MGNFPMLIIATVVAGTGQGAAPDRQTADTADLAFVSDYPGLPGDAYGLDAIDALPRLYGQRAAAEIVAGQRTVWYSCPGAPRMSGGSRITFTFEAGQRYELVCQSGREAVIRPSDHC